MVRHSQNGYVSYDRSVLAPFMVGDRKFMFRRGAPGWLLWHCISWFDANIADINPGIPDDWSYAERPIRGGDGSDPDNDSNHASGTAGDVDATRWPLGREPSAYLSADQIRRLREHLKVYEGCIRWGGDYTGRKDPMHFEIDRDEATCDRVMAKLQKAAGNAPAAPIQEDDMAVIISSSGTGKFGPRVPALYAGPGAFVGLAGAAEQAAALAKLPEIRVEPGTWDALASDRATLLGAARAQVEARDMLKQLLAAQQAATTP